MSALHVCMHHWKMSPSLCQVWNEKREGKSRQVWDVNVYLAFNCSVEAFQHKNTLRNWSTGCALAMQGYWYKWATIFIDISNVFNWGSYITTWNKKGRKNLKWAAGSYHRWAERAESKGEDRMIRKNPTELWRPTCRCLWPDWMSRSQGTQSLFRAWINGSWLDFGGLLRCFCLLWHRPPLCEVSLLLSDKGTTFFEKRKTENEETATGGGDRWEGMSRLFLHHVVFFRARRGVHLCFYVLILHTPVCVCTCVCPWDNNEHTVLEHSLLNISAVCLLYNEIRSFLFEDFCGIFPFSTLQWKNYEMNGEHGDKDRHLHMRKNLKSQSVHYIRKWKRKRCSFWYLIVT